MTFLAQTPKQVKIGDWIRKTTFYNDFSQTGHLSSQTRTEILRGAFRMKKNLDSGIPNYDPFFTKMILIVAGPLFGKCAPLSVLFKAGGKPFNLGSRQSTYRVDDESLIN